MSIETSYLEQGLRNSQISLPQKRRSIAIFYDKTISPSCQPTADFMAWLGREMCKIDGEGGSPRNVLGPSTGFAEAGNNITDISSFALPFPSSRSAPSLRRDAGCLLTTEMQKCFAAASRQASNSQGRLLSMPRMPNARKGHGWRQRMRFRRARVSEEGRAVISMGWKSDFILRFLHLSTDGLSHTCTMSSESRADSHYESVALREKNSLQLAASRSVLLQRRSGKGGEMS